MTSSLGYSFSDWILPGALNTFFFFFFFWITYILRSIYPFGCKDSKENPSTGANVRDVNRGRCCAVCTSAPGLFQKPSPALLPLAFLPFPGPRWFFYNPPRPNISGHQDSKSPSSDEQRPCAQNSFRRSPPSPFPCPWMFALSYLVGELCYLREMGDVAGLSTGMFVAEHRPPPTDTAMGALLGHEKCK